jgi:hypothetical protein
LSAERLDSIIHGFPFLPAPWDERRGISYARVSA